MDYVLIPTLFLVFSKIDYVTGIGAAAAKQFASYGALLTIVGQNEQRLLQVAEKCANFKDNKPLCLLIDLTTPDGCEEVVRKTMETYGKIDILVNCAGKGPVTDLFDTSMEIFDELIAINLRVPYKLTKLCLPHLKNTKGNIVNVFAAPMKVTPGFLPFAMIRDALQRFTNSGGLETASVDVRMNAVRPGITRTNFLANFNVSDDDMKEAYDKIAEIVPNKVIIEPEEVAKLILFAASDICPNMNASNLVLDGAASYY